MKRLVAAVGLVSVLLAAPAVGGGLNWPLDTDGDGKPDWANVSDWDADGTLEMSDIQAAINALTDSGSKVVQIQPGDFAPPPAPGGDILRLPSHFTLRGSGQGVTVLHGYPANDLTSTGAVVVNAGLWTGSEDITITDLEVDGGWGSGDATNLGHARAGILLGLCHSCRVERVTIRDTLHTCLYTRNGDDVHFHDNTLLRCGNYAGSGERYPCIYLYVYPEMVQQNVYVTDNLCIGAGHAGLNVRNGGGVQQNLLFSGNWTMDTRVIDGKAEGCIVIHGVSGALYQDNGCVNTGSLWVLDSNDVVVDGLVIDTPIGTHGVQLLGSHNLTLRNLSIAHPAGYGIALLRSNDGNLPDHENLTIENSTVIDAAGGGIASFDYAPVSLANVRIEGNLVDGAGGEGIGLIGAMSPASHGVVVRGNVLRDFGRTPGGPFARGISLSGAISEPDVRDNVVQDVDDQAEYGIVHDTWPVPNDLSYLCENEFLGTLAIDEEYFVASAVAEWQSDPDLDAHVDACDCADADPTTYPGAGETNDATDNQCPGDVDYGVVDEISGACGFQDPSHPNRYAWTAQPGAVQYEVLRSSKPYFSNPCAQWMTSSTTVIDPGVPPPARCYYYVVRALAPHLGSWGAASDGTERTGLCPAGAGKQGGAEPPSTSRAPDTSRPRSRSARLHPDR